MCEPNVYAMLLVSILFSFKLWVLSQIPPVSVFIETDRAPVWTIGKHSSAIVLSTPLSLILLRAKTWEYIQAIMLLSFDQC